MRPSTHQKQYKLLIPAIFSVSVIAVMAFALWSGSSGPDQSGGSLTESAEPEAPVVADFWQEIPSPIASHDSGTEAVAAEASTQPADKPTLDYVSVQDQLLKIKVDENGDVILDRDASNRLAAGFQNVPLPLDPNLIKDLENTITHSLPSPLGEQVADIVSDYHDYLVAMQGESAMFGPPQNIEEHQQRLEQKIELQAVILGEANARKLFEQENTDQMFMLKGMELATNQELTPEQRKASLEELADQRQQIKPAINNWDARYEQYEINREAIQSAALSGNDKERQIKSLYKQSFDLAERARIEDLGTINLK